LYLGKEIRTIAKINRDNWILSTVKRYTVDNWILSTVKRYKIDNWILSTVKRYKIDNWILSTVKRYKIECFKTPIQFSAPKTIDFGEAHNQIVDNEIIELL
jgi:hypothetical protein